MPAVQDDDALLKFDTGLTDYQQEFSAPDVDTENFYDFTQAVHVPDVQIIFQNMRMLQNVCLLPNMHLLIEGGLLD